MPKTITQLEQTEGRIFTPGFIFIALANFLLFLSFYSLMPILPYFLRELCHAADSTVGLVLASYSVAAIVVRPIAGWMLDAFRRRPIYLISYALFMLVFTGYAFTTAVMIVVVLRMLHGLAFGTATVSGTTIVSCLVPQKRLGEGLGIYGLANTLSMAIGPLTGLWLFHQFGYRYIFFILAAVTLVGLLMAARVPVPPTPAQSRRRLSLKTLFLTTAITPSVALLFASVPYGMTTSYISLLADEYGLTVGAGLFYTSMAVGLGLSRIIGGRWVDRYSIPRIILLSFASVFCGYLLLTLSRGLVPFLLSALLIGISFGVIHPAFNTLYVKMAGPEMRGAATSTYLTAFDTGIGLGILFGGVIASHSGAYHTSFLTGVASVLLATLIFGLWGKFSKKTTSI